ncbi:MAG: GyrI-like domain-containing protein [Clostridia bacterium]|nr:GyrI-like domain-containing protein [Clostridia bacterium]
MNYECRVVVEPQKSVLYIHTTSSVQDLPMVLGRCYGEIMTYMHEKHISAHGAPYVAYYNMDMDNLDIDVGVPVDTLVESNQSNIKCGTIPSGNYVSTLHVGPYNKIESAYKALITYIEESGVRSTGAAYEYYLNDPQETPESELQTQVLFKLID